MSLMNKIFPMVNLVPVPDITQSQQLLSFPAMIDMSHLQLKLTDVEMMQIDRAEINLLLLIGLAMQLSQRGSPMQPMPEMQARYVLINEIDPNIISKITERYWAAFANAQSTITPDSFVEVVIKVIYQIYAIYNMTFWNILAEIMQQCTILNYTNVTILVHRVRTAHSTAILDIGVYGIS